MLYFKMLLSELKETTKVETKSIDNYDNEMSYAIIGVLEKLMTSENDEERGWTLPIKLNKGVSKNIYKIDTIYTILVTQSPPSYTNDEIPPNYNEINDEHDMFLEIGGIRIQKLKMGLNIMDVKIPVLLLQYNRILLYTNKDVEIRIEIGLYNNKIMSDILEKYNTIPYKINDTFQARSGVIEYIKKVC
jgi:hypothetical protein